MELRISGDAKLSIDVNVRADSIVAAFRGLTDAINQNTRSNNRMSKELDDLTAQVAAEISVENSAITLISGLADQLKAAGTDPAKLADLTAQMQSSSAALAAAVTANTPAAPPVEAPATDGNSPSA